MVETVDHDDHAAVIVAVGFVVWMLLVDEVKMGYDAEQCVIGAVRIVIAV